MKLKVKIGLLAAACALSACSVLEGDRIDYKSASKGQTLEVPPDLTQLSRDTRYHRSSQYRNVAAAGATAMLYMSEVPTNQIQIASAGSPRSAAIPASSAAASRSEANRTWCAASRQRSTRSRRRRRRCGCRLR